MLAMQMILPRPSWRVVMSKVHRITSSVQHICCTPAIIREHGPKQPIDNVHMHYVSSETTEEMWMVLHHYQV